ncbi:hypothetical protein Slin15195_G122130 [Septoria linicola]|uniref:Uncharacterized protein n=1 Tax=Septoria linicola TaxID=215465 RepID=A0A9Q9B0U1_9PEZI|nr:hypothetical protein Slin14017_G078340 [Septoria linicola]USW58894.1 hypothetical protein Slin15195_G122130 [Septoria linicola]
MASANRLFGNPDITDNQTKCELPSHAKSGQYRRQVRSHITKEQHRKAKAFAASKKNKTSPRPSPRTHKPTPGQARTAKSNVSVDLEHALKLSTPTTDAAARTLPVPASVHVERSALYSNKSCSPLPQLREVDRHRILASQSLCCRDEVASPILSRKSHKKKSKVNNNSFTQDRSGRQATPKKDDATHIVKGQKVASPEGIGVEHFDPFDCSSVPYEPWYDELLHHMMTVFAPRAWPSLHITPREGMKWETFMTRHAMEEPALFYVRLLFASGDMVRLGTITPGQSFPLQIKAIKSINEAICDPKRCTSDGLILAVGRIALHECIYGNRDEADLIHRPAQRRMIDMRGGMSTLEFPELVKRLMRWSDRVMSMQGGTQRLLPDDEERESRSYGIYESLDAFEAWAPEPGQALRKGIAVADLVD